MEWIFETAYALVEGFRSVANVLTFEVVIPAWTEQVWNDSVVGFPYPFPSGDLSVNVLELMFGAGLAFYVVYTVIKWLLDIIL